ncbi:unnamed protein product [Fraxinus pennsylvanica]|uniref:Uncharacterized protein n=1 Tax=Fraxinus pennsylvanica TaxID=56036 RepID=A0AAD2ADT2_9LAMI|nr:unnamed protein product [Fraxinus pennsylvanica]
MRTAFYEIMRKHRDRPIGVLPWATFGCSIATCTGLLLYGDGIECAAETFPVAPSVASLGRGIRSLHQAAEASGKQKAPSVVTCTGLLIYGDGISNVSELSPPASSKVSQASKELENSNINLSCRD